jgi:RND family efflux transporter MFP subunit
MIALLLAALFVAGCGQTTRPPRGPKEPEVVVTTPISYEVTDYQDFTGRLTAIKTVEIRARVSGYVNSVNFKEGDMVRKGELLFQVDPRSYVADLNQAKANVKLARADANLQQKIAARAEDLYSRKAISREDYETCVATWEKSRANVRALEEIQARAQLYVDYTRVTSPLDGRISYRNVDPGNLIVADSTLLTTIVTENPQYIYFDVDERTFVELSESASQGTAAWFSRLGFPVLMRLATEDEFTHIGTADFIDNRVNANTGTIRMRAIFQNPKGYLKSGLFARVRLPIGNPYQALLIPDEAVQSDQGRKIIYVVNDKNEVVYRRVQLGHSIQGLRVIKDGLKKGERVIKSGMQRVRQGDQVRPKMEKPPKPPKSSLEKLLAFHRQKNKTTGRGSQKVVSRQEPVVKGQKRARNDKSSY